MECTSNSMKWGNVIAAHLLHKNPCQAEGPPNIREESRMTVTS
jgi:hypothetical protein